MIFQNFYKLFCLLLILGIVIMILNLNTGFLDLNFSNLWKNDEIQKEVISLRINRVWIITLAGLSIPTSGFILQEYFQNPLAGPSVLGISSVASLFVAFYILLFKDVIFPEFFQNILISSFAILGSFLALMFLLFLARKTLHSSYLIIFGFLISSLSGAVVSILQFYTDNESLRSYILWSFGGNNQVTFSQNGILSLMILGGLFLTFKAIKPLIGLTLGEQYALSFGVNLAQLKILVITASSLLSASVTAFLGPVLFIGVIVPHFCRKLWNPAQLWHQWILNMISGVLILHFFSILSETLQLPLNIITSLFGIPMIFLMLWKK